MKQLIVLLSTIILGIFIGGMIIGFKSDAATMKSTMDSKFNALNDTLKASCICEEFRA